MDSLMPASGVETVDATGLYCILTTGETYRAVDFSAWGGGMGLDVAVTWALKQSGRSLAVDWRVPCGHLTESGVLTVSDAERWSVVLE